VARTNRGFEPLHNRCFARRLFATGWLVDRLHRLFDAADDHDHRVVRYEFRKRIDALKSESDGRRNGLRSAHVANVKADLRLLTVRCAKHFAWSSEIQQHRLRGKYDEHRNPTNRRCAGQAAASFSASARASSTVAIRAKRPSSTSSVCSRIWT